MYIYIMCFKLEFQEGVKEPVDTICQVKIREADKSIEQPMGGRGIYGPSVEVTHTSSSHVPLTRISLFGHSLTSRETGKHRLAVFPGRKVKDFGVLLAISYLS